MTENAGLVTVRNNLAYTGTGRIGASGGLLSLLGNPVAAFDGDIAASGGGVVNISGDLTLSATTTVEIGVDGTALGGGLEYSPVYNTTNLTLDVVPLPSKASH